MRELGAQEAGGVLQRVDGVVRVLAAGEVR